MSASKTVTPGTSKKGASAREELLLKQVEFLSTLNGLDPREISRSIVKHTKGLTGADRVTLILPEGKLLATTDARSTEADVVAGPLFAELARAVLDYGSGIYCSFDPDGTRWYGVAKYGELFELDGDEIEVSLESPIRELYAVTGSAVIGAVIVASEDKPIAIMIVEQFKSPVPKPFLGEKVDLTAQQVGGRLNSALVHDRLPMVHTQRKLAEAKKQAGGLGMAIRLIVLATVLIAPFFITMDLNMEGEGTLDPEFRFEAVHGYPTGLAEVTEVHVRHGQEVKAGDTLFVLRSRELERQIAEVSAQVAAKEGEERELRTALFADRGEMSPADREKSIARIQSLRNELISKRKEVSALQAMRQSLVVKAKTDGVIVKPKDFHDYLGRPFGPKDPLATVIDPSKEWLVHLWVTQDQMAHIREAQQREGSPELTVRFYLGTDPKTHYSGKIREIDQQMEVRPNDKDQKPRILIKVAVDRDQLRYAEAGATVTGLVHCGQSNLYYWGLWKTWNKVSEIFFY